MVQQPAPKRARYTLAAIISFLILARYNVLNVTNIIFLCIGLVAPRLHGADPSINASKHRPKAVSSILWLTSSWFAFSLIGPTLLYGVFNNHMGNCGFAESLFRVFAFAAVSVALYPCIVFLYQSLFRLHSKFIASRTPGNTTASVKAGLSCASIALVVGILATIAFYPCTMTEDSAGHWTYAKSDTTALSDYHPLAYSMLLKLVLRHADTPAPYAILQFALLAIAVGDLCSFLACTGVSRRTLQLGTLVFSLMPSTFMLPLYLSKNPLSCILNLWVMITLVEFMLLPKKYGVSLVWYTKGGVAIAGLFLVRDNNIAIVLPLVLMLAWQVAHDRKRGAQFAALLVCSACLVGMINGYCYTTLDYTHSNKHHETVRPLLAPAASALQLGMELPEQVEALMLQILPKEEWVARYDAYNSDTLTWGDPMPRYCDVTLREGIAAYLQMLVRYPDVVVWDRLNATSIIWNVGTDGIAGIIRCPTGLTGLMGKETEELPLIRELDAKRQFANRGGILRRASVELNKLFSSILALSTETMTIDVLVWRCGVYGVLLLVEVAYLVANNRLSLIFTMGPTLAILLTYILVIAWQMYFYLWFFPMAVVLFGIVCVIGAESAQN